MTLERIWFWVVWIGGGYVAVAAVAVVVIFVATFAVPGPASMSNRVLTGLQLAAIWPVTVGVWVLGKIERSRRWSRLVFRYKKFKERWIYP